MTRGGKGKKRGKALRNIFGRIVTYSKAKTHGIKSIITGKVKKRITRKPTRLKPW